MTTAMLSQFPCHKKGWWPLVARPRQANRRPTGPVVVLKRPPRCIADSAIASSVVTSHRGWLS
jgi:hypothetical protein